MKKKFRISLAVLCVGIVGFLVYAQDDEPERDADVMMELEMDEREMEISELKRKLDETEEELEFLTRERAGEEIIQAKKVEIQKLHEALQRLKLKFMPEVDDIHRKIEILSSELEAIEEKYRAMQLKDYAPPEDLARLRDEMEIRHEEIGRLKEMAKMHKKMPEDGRHLELYHARFVEAEHLVEITEEFLTEAGVIKSDPRTNYIIVMDVPIGVERAFKIIKALDIPVEGEMLERFEERDEEVGVVTGKIIEANAKYVTVKGFEEGETIRVYVPVREAEADRPFLDERLSEIAASLQVGDRVRIKFVKGGDTLWIKDIKPLEEEYERLDDEIEMDEWNEERRMKNEE